MSEEYRHLVDVLERSVASYGDHPLFGTKRDGHWRWLSYREFGRRVEAMRGGLAGLGIGAGSTVAIISGNRWEWAVLAYATYSLGARFCAMYETQLEKDWRYIVEDSEAEVLFVSRPDIYEKARRWVGDVGRLRHVFCLALPVEDEASFLAVEERGRAHPAPVAEVDGDTVCCAIYTSGTTGKPKGVILTHGNVVSNLNAVNDAFPCGPGDVSVSFLPWAHSFGHTAELHAMLGKGAAMAIAESVDRLVANFAEIRPTVLYAVPRVFNRIYDGVRQKVAEGGGLKQRLFDAALNAAEAKHRLQEAGRGSLWIALKHRILDRLVLAKVRDRFGGRLRFAVSGGAALSPQVAAFIDRLGIPVFEGYGLTETSPVVSSNMPGARRMGSVGRPIQGVEVLIDRSVVEDEGSDEGEILVKGPNIMQGYHGLPEETAAVLTPEGAFRTGDLGHLDDDGYLYITGRLKEQYKLENGKYVVPAPLEETLQLSPFVAQAYIHGDNRPHNVALIVPDRRQLARWAEQQGLSAGGDDLLEHESVRGLFEREIEEHSRGFKSYERIKGFKLLADEFAIDNGFLTPKLSLKRNVVRQRYESDLEALYAERTAA